MKFRLSRFLLTMFCCELAGLAWGQYDADRMITPQSSKAPHAITPSAQTTSPSVSGLSGRLFFSGEQRERMDRARARGDTSTDTAESEPAPSTLNGFVKRSDGSTVIWVDSEARYNVRAEGLQRLRPQDVGSTSERIQVLIHEEAAATVPRAGNKRVAKKPRSVIRRVSKTKVGKNQLPASP